MSPKQHYFSFYLTKFRIQNYKISSLNFYHTDSQIMPHWKFIRFIVHAGSTDRILLPRIRTIIDHDSMHSSYSMLSPNCLP